MKISTDRPFQSTVAARIAGEDIRPNDWVAVLYKSVEIPPWLCDFSESGEPSSDPVHRKAIPKNAGKPYRVAAVCLPFVYVTQASGKLKTIDIRRTDLVRLDDNVARQLWKKLRKQLRKERKSSGG